jgi:hypothetical protein
MVHIIDTCIALSTGQNFAQLDRFVSLQHDGTRDVTPYVPFLRLLMASPTLSRPFLVPLSVICTRHICWRTLLSCMKCDSDAFWARCCMLCGMLICGAQECVRYQKLKYVNSLQCQGISHRLPRASLHLDCTVAQVFFPSLEQGNHGLHRTSHNCHRHILRILASDNTSCPLRVCIP